VNRKHLCKSCTHCTTSRIRPCALLSKEKCIAIDADENGRTRVWSCSGHEAKAVLV